MHDESVASTEVTAVASDSVEHPDLAPHTSILTSGDVVIVALVNREGTEVARLHILGSDLPSDRLLIGVSVQDKTRNLTTVVYGPLEQMTSAHVRRAGRSVAAFPGSTAADVEIGERGSAPSVG